MVSPISRRKGAPAPAPRCADRDRLPGPPSALRVQRARQAAPLHEPEKCLEEHAEKYLRPDKINYIKQKFPRSNYPIRMG
jgi:hypothetical protein